MRLNWLGIINGLLKDHGFNSWSGHVPGLQVQPLVRVYMRENRSMFLSLSNSLLSPRFGINKRKKS